MSWLTDLAETYDANASETGNISGEHLLLPIYHNSPLSGIEVKLDDKGNFLGAEALNSEKTIIPVTEESAGRTSGIAPHPLEDNLQYIAGDFALKKGEKVLRFGDCFDKYISNLKNWCESDFSHPKVQAIYTYLSKRTLAKDLISAKVLYGEDGVVFQKDDKIKNVEKVLVRFSVISAENPVSACYKDESLFAAWINYRRSIFEYSGLCYATGEIAPLASSHPKYIRNSGDGAKLISSNDGSNFTYRGLFTEANQAYGVSAEISQKAHLALRWLIEKQGVKPVKMDKTVFVTWNIGKTEKKLNYDDFLGLFYESKPVDDTKEEYAKDIKKAVHGLKSEYKRDDSVAVIGLSAAVKGRLAVIYYRKFGAFEFFDRLERWYGSLNWLFPYYENKKRLYKVKTPNTYELISAAYGFSNVADSLKQRTFERITHCILDGMKLPYELVENAVRRVSKPVTFNDDDEWERSLSYTCAMYAKYYEKEHYEMALDENRTTREYLFGRLLAIADDTESRALKKMGIPRSTAAQRYFAKFAVMPATVWALIERSLQPYLQKPDVADWINKLIDDIMSKFEPDDFNDLPLHGEYLLGYHTERAALSKRREQSTNKTNSEE